MGSVGAPEVLVILVLALLVLGPERLPQAARTMGRWMGELRKLTGSLQAEVRDVVDDVMRPVNETATVATESFTSTFTSADSGTTANPVEVDGTTTASPSMASSDPEMAEDATEAVLAADVPLPGARESVDSPRPFPVPPVDPSLN